MPSSRKSYPPGQRRFGAHVSIAGGLHMAFDRAAEHNCDCLQVFVKNQRQWRGPPLADRQVKQWDARRNETKLEPVIAHGSYLLNPASLDADLWEKTIDAMEDELNRCEKLNIRHLVIHPGSHGGNGEAPAIRRVAEALDTLHNRCRGFRSRIALETTAGQGSSIGYRIENLADIIERTKESERLAVCLDTCHLFAAGYDLKNEQAYEDLLGKLAERIGLNRLAGIHLNDSLRPCGSRVDRHAHIGKGEIGRNTFRRMVNDPRLKGLPMILETPKEPDDRGRNMDKVNLATLRRMIR